MGLLMQVRVNWAFQKDQREDTSEHFNIFVGDLSHEVNDLALFEAFQHCEQCSDARVMWDHATNRYISLNSHAACGESCFHSASILQQVQACSLCKQSAPACQRSSYTGRF